MIGRTLIAVTGLMLTFADVPALAQRVCTEPVSPTCVDVETTYQSERTLERCERDVKSYLEDVDRYVRCLEAKAEAKRESARTLNERFECRARGETGCPE